MLPVYSLNIKKRFAFCFTMVINANCMLPGLEKLAAELESINDTMERVNHEYIQLIENVHPTQRKNAENLLNYLVLRNLDIRELQNALHGYGLSSLANAEAHIRGQLIEILCRLGRNPINESRVFSYEESSRSLKEKSKALFGERTDTAIPHIMVTFHSKFADDYGKVKSLLQSGMTVARINCAHDDEATWFKMIQHIKRASYITGLQCKIYMDLAGPKIRTSFRKKEKMKIAEGQAVFLTDEETKFKGYKKSLIRCTVPAIASQLKIGDTVLFDDGVIEAKVQHTENGAVTLQILRISSGKKFLRNEKGMNFPDSHINVSALTDYDRKCLPFILANADMMGYSFVRTPQDLDDLNTELGESRIPIILKIETPEAVNNLPALLFHGMREKSVGVMIARGDLAVEIGFERLSEVQEEILWLCESAHIPVIWATQVLENMNKSGLASRSEVTDAAHASQADCVMINKGDHVIRVLESLREILYRSSGHHIKKRYTFRQLSVAKAFLASRPT